MNPIALAGCVITDNYGRILLIHRNTDQFQHWELPGGKIEENEMAEDAAVRELQEELGLKVVLTAPLGNEVFSDDNGDFRYYWFSAQIIDGEPMVKETDKFDDVDYIDLEDFSSLSLSANMLILEDKLLRGEVSLDT